MSAITHTVEPEPGFRVSATVDPRTPQDMSVDVAAVNLAAFAPEDHQELFDLAVAQLEALMDAEPSLAAPARSVEPVAGLTVEVHADIVTVTNSTPGDWTLLGSAGLAGALIGQAVGSIRQT